MIHGNRTRFGSLSGPRAEEPQSDNRHTWMSEGFCPTWWRSRVLLQQRLNLGQDGKFTILLKELSPKSTWTQNNQEKTVWLLGCWCLCSGLLFNVSCSGCNCPWWLLGPRDPVAGLKAATMDLQTDLLQPIKLAMLTKARPGPCADALPERRNPGRKAAEHTLKQHKRWSHTLRLPVYVPPRRVAPVSSES